MKKFTIVAAMLCIGLSTGVFAQTDTKKSAPPQMTKEEEEMMKVWEAYATPGEMHKMLAKDDGVWKEELTMWWSPGAEPVKNTATATNSMILGGRYQQSVHKGEFQGMPFEGISTVGYDNARKKYVSTWIDNMGTGIMYMEGTWDPATKTINFKGKQVDPATGKDTDVREEFVLVDDNTQVLRMYMTPAGGKEYKSMEIKFTRGK